ncbi:poly-gamma-glutamate hydrolase family protein [Gymnodinialimonas ceratoperidinii]|uniref:Poly-gamma-glutamate hydrolase family protein n=1 Tax=Gymnodinialimonas ceratoperidinii TaxID=2856823 RepID=A0A8F6Y9K4_9RHOB|nr:poly-gamma-glutamate hydrolase family protein [Gymnodinialimonas ceratoperidinii]QXT39039.1 poly-gamma-glutamate hydrolase family protein [Gymnodinialimonas ceratoperidinii]
MVDRYATFADLAAASVPDVDYRIKAEDRGTPVVILAPHGGTIEPETAEIAEAIAGEDYSFYAFEALNPGAHGDFHITSHRFDEPGALEIVGGAYTAVAIHGRKDDGTDTVWLGGRATDLRDAIGTALQDAGFDAAPNETLPGIHETNICNRTRSGEGVQLELPMTLRRSLASDRAALERFCTAIRTAIEAADIK